MPKRTEVRPDFEAAFEQLGHKAARELFGLARLAMPDDGPVQLTPELMVFVNAWARGWAREFGIPENQLQAEIARRYTILLQFDAKQPSVS